MKALFRILVESVFLVTFTWIASPAWAGSVVIYPLFAGQNMEVGTVTAEEDGDGNVTVTYSIDTENNPGMVLTEIHLSVGDPPKKSAPGRFPYEALFDESDGVTSYSITVMDVDLQDGCTNIAAHAVVSTLGGLTGLAFNLPNSVTGSLQHPGVGGESYFTTTVSGGTFLDGVYAGFCVDTDRGIRQGFEYTMLVYSSYEDLPEDTVEFPENLPLVNYIINQDYVGQEAFDGAGVSLGFYTYGDVQRAIWALIEDNQSGAGLGSWSQARVDQILLDTFANGLSFEPVCEQQVAVILIPVDANGNTVGQITIGQVTLIELDLPCETTDETAWALGNPEDDTFTLFSAKGKGWGGYNEACFVSTNGES